jgi:hypothetical protein
MSPERNPQQPGIPVNLDQLKRQAKTEHRTRNAQNAPVAIPPPEAAMPPLPTKEEAPPPAAIPDAFEGGDVHKKQAVHPLLKQLNQEFGLEKLKTEIVELGNHRWEFRPKDYSALEWVTERIALENQGRDTITGVSAINVAAHLAAVDGVAVHTLFNIDTLGRHIADSNNPPVDIRRQASEAVLDWLKNDIGLTELVEELESRYSASYERQRRDAYPLWRQLASTYHQMMVSLGDQEVPTKETTVSDSPTGDASSPLQPPSPQKSEQDTSGPAPTL